MKVREIMTANPASCTPETSLDAVARSMEQHDCGALPVVASAGSGVVGIITDRDIVIRAVAKGRNPLDVAAEPCMTSPVVTVDVDTRVDECITLMETKQIRRVPVVDSAGRLVGIVAQADIARHQSRKESGELLKGVSSD